MTLTKLNQADLDSPCRELSNYGLNIVVALVFFWELIFRVFLPGVQSSCNTKGYLFLRRYGMFEACATTYQAHDRRRTRKLTSSGPSTTPVAPQ